MTVSELFWQEARLRWTRTALLRLAAAALLVLLLDAVCTALFLLAGMFDVPGIMSPSATASYELKLRLISLSQLGNSPWVLSNAPLFGKPPLTAGGTVPYHLRLWAFQTLDPLLSFLMPGVLTLTFLNAKHRAAEALERGATPRTVWWGMGLASALPFLVLLLVGMGVGLCTLELGSAPGPGLGAHPLSVQLLWLAFWLAEAVFCVAVGALARRKDVALMLCYGWFFLLLPQLPFFFGWLHNPVPPELFALREAVEALLRNEKTVLMLGLSLVLHRLSLRLLVRRMDARLPAVPQAEQTSSVPA